MERTAKHITRLLLYFLVASISTAGCKEDPLAVMPAFEILLTDSSTMNTGNIRNNKPSILIHFESTCRGCQQETDTLLKYMDLLREVNIYFITLEDLYAAQLFSDHYKLPRFSNVMIGQDREMFFPRHFQTASTPFIAIYDADKKLRGIFQGQANTQKLLTTIKEIN